MNQKNANAAFDPQQFLSKVNGGRTVVEYAPDQAVYHQGAPADAVFYIQRGKAKVTVTSEQGKEAMVAFIAVGDFFGEGCLTGQPQRLATVTALTQCLVTCIPKQEVISVLHEEPAFSELFIAHLLARNSRVEEDLVDQLFNSSEKRLARALRRSDRTVIFAWPQSEHVSEWTAASVRVGWRSMAASLIDLLHLGHLSSTTKYKDMVRFLSPYADKGHSRGESR